MDYYKISSKISSKTNNELITMALTEDPALISSVVQEAWRRQHAGLMYMLASSSKIISNHSLFNIIVKYIETTKDESNKIDILHALLSHSPSEYSQSLNIHNLVTITGSSPKLAAIALISYGTPLPVITKIIKTNKLNDPKEALFADASFIDSKISNQNKILESIFRFLKEGYSLENLYAAGILLKRIDTNAGDRFVAEIAKFNMNPEIAGEFDKLSKQWGKYNPMLLRNFSNNQSEGVKNFKLSQSLLTIEQNPRELIPDVLNYIENESRIDAIQHIYNLFKYKCDQYREVFNVALYETPSNGKNIFVVFSSQNAKICEDCLNFILKNFDKYGIENLHEIRDIIIKIATMAIYDFGLKHVIKKIPNNILDYIPLKPEDRIEPSKESPQKEKKPYNLMYPRKIASIQKDWYEYAKLVSKI